MILLLTCHVLLHGKIPRHADAVWPDDRVHDGAVIHAKEILGKKLSVDFYSQTVDQTRDRNLSRCDGRSQIESETEGHDQTSDGCTFTRLLECVR